MKLLLSALIQSIIVISTITKCRCFVIQPHIISTTRTNTSIGSTISDQEQTTSSDSSLEVNVDDGISVSTDAEYPYLFTGRLWFSPSIVKVPSQKMKETLPSNSNDDSGVDILSLFGYTIGGTVTLEYDTSPVGPYKEFVTMSSLVMKRTAVGQWGSRLYVSNQVAEDVCREVWGVPAEVANIDFYEHQSSSSNDNDSTSSSSSTSTSNKPSLMVTKHPNPNAPTDEIQTISVEGWDKTRILKPNEYTNGGIDKRYGAIPVLWTPTIKALWSPWVAGGIFAPPTNEELNDDTSKSKSNRNVLPLHKLRLSASAIRLSWSGLGRRLEESNQVTDDDLGLSLGIGLIVDNVKIEIGTRYGRL
jgi:hypothetical protein